jgi:dimethylaniline monooxygenase (N-oxide forming)
VGQGTAKAPLDFVFYSQPQREDFTEIRLKTSLGNQQTNTAFATQYCDPIQSDPSSPLYVSASSTQPQGVVISEDYIALVKQGRIVLKFHEMPPIDAEAVVYCTGYRCVLPFFAPATLAAMRFDPEDLFDPLPLYKATWSPLFPNLGFVGLYRGPFPKVLHAQAEWVAKVIGGKVRLPSVEGMCQQVDTSCQIRGLPKADRPQFSHWDYRGLLHEIEKESM